MLLRKKILLMLSIYCACLNLATAAVALAGSNQFLKVFGENKLVKIAEARLPKPFDFLLTQPLMTFGLEKYYQRQAQIKVIYKQENELNHTYSRGILMLMDSNKKRNNIEIARAKKEAVVVEIALITMNFKALPQKVITGVLHSEQPFGKLLSANHVKTVSSGREYFLLNCNEKLANLIHCKTNSKLYGRVNTLSRADDNRWLAKVIEVLPLVSCTDSQCKTQ
ncbi:hypothetical protein [Legionella cardiaca]|uniref:Uncharacterized protein n=1 Tax=Legionella cardiaca TaxID=1071983 RepID=A0ABY8ASF2_9GAMM|nr:hypothetical protein [Legionella cardiaca]WED42706.1 hypothetical protein PXX05_12495 [Legionella cardiaca]